MSDHPLEETGCNYFEFLDRLEGLIEFEEHENGLEFLVAVDTVSIEEISVNIKKYSHFSI